MLDFTSALYLGFGHPSASLAPWQALTLGRPAALEEPPGAGQVAADLAHLTGAAAGLLFPSTLHLFRDLFHSVVTPGCGPRGVQGDAHRAILLMDAQSYPIARWGAEGVRLDGTACETYPHHDAAALARKARRAFRAGLRPIVVTDGFCPSCGRLAPLPALAGAAAEHGGHLIVDDTQALGVLGASAGKTVPSGRGGGGTLGWFGLGGPHISAGSSLAKGFGAPLAVLLGGKDTIERIAREGDSRVHTSPPSAASIAAAAAALMANVTAGDLLRARLGRRIGQLRQGLARIGACVMSTLPFPVQTIALSSPQSARAVLAALEQQGIRALVTKACQGGMSLSVLLTATHAAADINRLIEAVAAALRLDTHGNGKRMEMS
jgi:8-amino-7-oxononanoate synthase